MTKKADLTEKKQGRRGPKLADAEQLRQLLFPTNQNYVEKEGGCHRLAGRR